MLDAKVSRDDLKSRGQLIELGVSSRERRQIGLYFNTDNRIHPLGEQQTEADDSTARAKIHPSADGFAGANEIGEEQRVHG